jgi:hypothetical protein
MSGVGDFYQVVEARREGPKPLIRITRFTVRIKQIRMQKKHWRRRFKATGSWFLAPHKESTIPKWSHCYNPIFHRITW